MMKKTRLMVAAVAAAGMALAGCSGRADSGFNPSQSSVYAGKDGSLSSALVLETEEEAASDELKTYLEGVVDRYNEGAGEAEEGGEAPVVLDSCSVKDGVMTAVFRYRGFEDLAGFRQSDENEDDSNTFTALEVKDTAEAGKEGWFDGSMKKADGSEASALDIGKEQNAVAVRVQGGGCLEVGGEILYMSSSVEKLSNTAVTVPDESTSVVVFK